MPNESSTDAFSYPTPEEMKEWLQQEIRDATKALELRTREASEFVNAYAAGKLTPEEAHERHWKYDHRWGEALPGAHALAGFSDEQILAFIDKAQGKYESTYDIRKKYASRFERKEPKSGQSL